MPRQQPNGVPSAYIDPRYAQGPNYVNMPQLAAAAQDPNHPANPSHPKVSMHIHPQNLLRLHLYLTCERERAVMLISDGVV